MSTTFCLDDMDHTVKFLIAIGVAGRKNIKRLKFSWRSKAETATRERRALWPEGSQSWSRRRLPAMHASRCLRLLGDCWRLKELVVFIELNLRDPSLVKEFDDDPAVSALRGLCRMRRIGLKIYSVMHSTGA